MIANTNKEKKTKMAWNPRGNYYQHFPASVQSLSCVRLFATPWIATRQASLSITNSQSSLKFMSVELVMPYSHLILCRPLLLLPSIPPSIRVFSNDSTLRMRWPKYWSFSFSIIPSKEHPELISFRMDWLDLLSVQAYLKLLIFLPEILILAHGSCNSAFHVMYSACKLNKQGGNIQPWRTPFQIWNQSVVPCSILTVASWLAYIFLRGQVRWSGIPIFLGIFHSLLWSTQ